MTFTIKIACDNEAFSPEPTTELARILREIATQLENGKDYSHFITIHDVNGNDVGRVKLADRQ